MNVSRIIAAVVAVSFFSMHTLALAATDPAANLSGVQSMVLQYNVALAGFRHGGRGEFLKKIPQGFFSEADKKFISEQVIGSPELPRVQIEDNKIVVSLHRGVGANERLVLELEDGAKNEFSVNGKRFIGQPGVEQNNLAIQKLLGYSTARDTGRNFDLSEIFISRAQAFGASGSTLLIAALIAVAAGLIAYFVVAGLGKKSSVNTSNTTSGPVTGDPTVIKVH